MTMPSNLTSILDAKIAELEHQIAALKTARAALGGSPASTGADGRTRRGRRTFSAAQRAEISRRMKALWARRKSGK
jgi:hypothetical protein